MRRYEVPEFRKALRTLRETCPPIVPVKVRSRRMVEDCLGMTTLVRDSSERPSHFNISIDDRLPLSTVLHILLHEWAHALSWTEGVVGLDDHGPEWGLAMSRVYQQVVAP